ncbi:hypothetical protein ABBQ38_007265 [Trebouxia sp. C0009 RCD-2024]
MVGKKECPVLRPSRKEFSIPFADYVSTYFRNNPDVPIIKVIPPEGYKPRSTEYPAGLRIEVPIEQNVLNHTNRAGFYDCVLLAKPSLTVEEFRKVAKERGEPESSDNADELHERKFWKALGSNPPLYGADTPQSLFDEKLEFGWNLRKLGCLLQQYGVQDIPGVTTPMTYFGMWRSFFSWHVEDVDLLSINYLHYGASKVWYAVPPGEPRRKFERMAQGLFPDAARQCPNFLRHKTIMLTTTLLRDNDIPFVKVKHNPGEFIVLNAGAYHAGFNQGFNCAEAVNFATEEWIPLGKRATRCCCKAMGKDAVRVDMSLFPGGQDSSSEDDNSTADGCDDMEVVESDVGSSSPPKMKRGGRKDAVHPKSRPAPVVEKRGPGRPRKSPLPDSPSKGNLKVKVAPLKVKAAARPASKTGRRAGDQAVSSSDEAGSQRGNKQANRQRQQLAGAGRKQQGQGLVEGNTTPINPKKRKGGQNAEPDASRAVKKMRKAPVATAKRKPRTNVQALSHPSSLPGASGPVPAEDVQHGGEPFLIVGRNDDTGVRFFYLVQMLKQPAQAAGEVRVRWLEQLADGLYHPSTKEWDESAGALSKVRTQKLRAKKDNHLCYKLLTLRSKIEAVELEN